MTGDSDQLEVGLAGVLERAGFEAPTVSISRTASNGATRRTVFIDISTAGAEVAAVAQISASTNQSMLPLLASHEAKLVGLALAAGVSVPSVLAFSDQDNAVGGSVLIAERVEGATIPRHILRLVADDSHASERLTEQCGTALAKLHSIPVETIPTSVPRVVDPSPCAAYVPTLSMALDHLDYPHPTLRFAIAWLDRNRPAVAAAPALVHGDFRNGNIVVDPGGLVAVLDWELAHIGDPMEDLAYLCMRTWRFGNHHLPVGGFGSMDVLSDAYVNAGGVWRDDAFDWWMIARTAWWGIGLAFQAAAFASGATRSIVHAASGRRVVELEYDLLSLLRTSAAYT